MLRGSVVNPYGSPVAAIRRKRQMPPSTRRQSAPKVPCTRTVSPAGTTTVCHQRPILGRRVTADAHAVADHALGEHVELREAGEKPADRRGPDDRRTLRRIHFAVGSIEGADAVGVHAGDQCGVVLQGQLRGGVALGGFRVGGHGRHRARRRRAVRRRLAARDAVVRRQRPDLERPADRPPIHRQAGRRRLSVRGASRRERHGRAEQCGMLNQSGHGGLLRGWRTVRRRARARIHHGATEGHGAVGGRGRGRSTERRGVGRIQWFTRRTRSGPAPDEIAGGDRDQQVLGCPAPTTILFVPAHGAVRLAGALRVLRVLPVNAEPPRGHQPPATEPTRLATRPM